jgi:stage V sporulation protein K
MSIDHKYLFISIRLLLIKVLSKKASRKENTLNWLKHQRIATIEYTSHGLICLNVSPGSIKKSLGLVDEFGNWKLKPIFSQVFVIGANEYFVFDNELRCFGLHDGRNWLIYPHLASGLLNQPFKDDAGLMVKDSKTKKWGIISCSGSWVIPPYYDEISCDKNFIYIRDNKMWGSLDPKNIKKWLVKPTCDSKESCQQVANSKGLNIKQDNVQIEKASSRKSNIIIKDDSIEKPLSQVKQEDLSIELNKLDSLIGLDSVKSDIKSLINFVELQKLRANKGLKTDQITYHLVFTGSPGTGKTEVAKIISKIYKALGILRSGHLIVASRSDLIADYLGQTASKTNKVVDSALGGVLFIDEAYSICRSGDRSDSYGQEAVDELIQRLENDRDKFAVILAGYKDDMDNFINTNPGFKSRINRFIDFPDYLPDDLFKIFQKMLHERDYVLDKQAASKVQSKINKDYIVRDKNFGNARYARNLLDSILLKQAERVMQMNVKSKEMLTILQVSDIPVS